MSTTALKTAADLAYDIICRKIIGGELSPGSKLSRRKMAALTGVSIIPVIEALHRLEDEGLVESFPYFGSQVIQLSEETIADRYALRMTGKGEAYTSALTRLANQNLAEVDPEPWVEFLLYSHPALGKRIAMARAGLSN